MHRLALDLLERVDPHGPVEQARPILRLEHPVALDLLKNAPSKPLAGQLVPFVLGSVHPGDVGLVGPFAPRP
eukprot:573028-Pyramimonas_sp.AAC.1